MAWVLKQLPTVVRCTVAIAEEWAQMEAASMDRPLQKKRMDRHATSVEAGEFRPVDWARAWCIQTQKYYRVNGKHTSTLFKDLTPAQIESMVLVISEYVCDTLEDVANLYATFDTQEQTRTNTDVYRAKSASIPELSGIAVREISLFAGALGYLPSNPSSMRSRAKDRANRLRDNIDVCIWLESLLTGDGAKKLGRVPVVAAIIGTWRKDPKAAETFWKLVRDETGGTPDTPDRKLAKFLESKPAVRRPSESSRRYVILHKEFYVKSIRAWNAWRTGKKTELRYSSDANIPEII